MINGNLDGKPDVIHEAYKFTINESETTENEPLVETSLQTNGSKADRPSLRSSTFLLDTTNSRAVQLKKGERSKTKDKNRQIERMIGEIFTKMNEFAKKRQVKFLS